MTENMNTVDLKSLSEKRRRDKIEQDDKTEREQFREIKELNNYISASSTSASSVQIQHLIVVILMTYDSHSNCNNFCGHSW